MVDAQASSQQRQHALHLGQLAVLVAECHDRVAEDLVDEPLLVVVRHVQLVEGDGVRLALLSAEGEDDDWQVASVVAHADDLLQVRGARLPTAPQLLLGLHPGGFGRLLERGDGFVEVVLPELALLVHDHVYSISTYREEVVLKRHWPLLGVDHVAWLVLNPADPLRELPGVRDRGGQEDQPDGVGQQDNGLLPDHPSVSVSHVVDLIEDHPSHLPADVRTPVQHGPQDLGGHDHARRVRVDRDVAGHQPDILELVLQVPVLLVAQRLDRGGIDNPLLVPQSHGDGILRDHGLAGRRMRRHKNGLAVLETRRRLALEDVEGEGVGLRRGGGGVALGPGRGVGGPGALVDASRGGVVVRFV
mmetsp:Transcript_106651/g.306834  ORF Transcript_106651/g.306834 Transcript_106651/m.306834 type:complete len:360 (-) Transcript_106651:293-1372(-)